MREDSVNLLPPAEAVGGSEVQVHLVLLVDAELDEKRVPRREVIMDVVERGALRHLGPRPQVDLDRSGEAVLVKWDRGVMKFREAFQGRVRPLLASSRVLVEEVHVLVDERRIATVAVSGEVVHVNAH